ncbi:hypothetical protein BOX15_Mlig010339g2 [Macrostomum lignano]|uniref:Tyrosine-protein phosphatase non-receptor type 9 n=1 Tax=Macrostomum lignano TaxID=282301 RepID=A0A267E6X3_9PLAT|nr:hypothetical protein BOX15_Mlig010339g2 [Macrostomum lignano]
MSQNSSVSLWYCVCEDSSASKLSGAEETALQNFADRIRQIPHCGDRLRLLSESQQRAVSLKFLRARKWDVQRAVDLFAAHEKLRRVEYFEHIDPCDEGVRAELLSEKLTIVPGQSSSDSVVALFTACRHRPPETTHRDTLKSLIFQLDAALAVDSAQENGLVFVYDMTGSKYGNFDYDLSIRILNMLKGNYPARLKKVLIVTAPIWFKAPFQVLRMFVREKLRDRVFIVNSSTISSHLSLEVLPGSLGGTRAHDHQAWLREACRRMGRTLPPDYFTRGGVGGGLQSGSGAASDTSSLTDDSGSAGTGRGVGGGGGGDWLLDGSVSMTDSVVIASGASGNGSSSRKRSPSIDGGGVSGGSGGNSPSKKRSGDGGSKINDDNNTRSKSMSLAAFAARISAMQREGLVEEFNSKLGPDRGSDRPCDAFRRNRDRNRYADVPCLDASRVRLKGGDSDYVHANWVDGYQQANAYICTQGPLPHTVPDFWSMVWQNNVGVIVMTTRLVEGRRTKCALYWPKSPGESQTYGDVTVTCQSVDDQEDLVTTELTITQRDSCRSVTHLQFTSWPDFGIPHAAGSFLKFLDQVRSVAKERRGPVLVHCSAGIGRTGTFLTVDIAMRRLVDTGEVDLLGTVLKLREQRAGSIQTAEQYVFCHLALLEFAANIGLLPPE